MDVFVERGDLLRQKSDALVVFQFEGEERSEIANRLDPKLGGRLSAVMRSGDFKGKLYETSIIYGHGAIQRVLLVGMGKAEGFDREKLRGSSAGAARKLRELNIRSFSVWLDPGMSIDDSPALTASAIVEGAILGLYRFLPFKTEKSDIFHGPDILTIIPACDEDLRAVKEAVERAGIISDAVCFTRDLVSSPANEMTPAIIGDKAQELQRGSLLRVDVLGPPALSKMKMNALLAVAKGSHEQPRFIIMDYGGAGRKERPVVLVGKGITFDSGGISLKPAEKMEEMKADMAGAASVVGTIRAISRMKLPLNVVGLIPAAENLPGGGAYRPGDVIKSLSGKTIEVISTDAEGRLLLADALTYAGKYNPLSIIDIATLTGACRIVFSDLAIGMLGTDAVMKEKVRLSGHETGEKVWELPLWDEYGEMIKSDVADLKNTGGREGGAITAACFLGKFAHPHPWVHLDIAGPAWLRKERPYIPKGASGVGVRLLADVLCREAESMRPGKIAGSRK